MLKGPVSCNLDHDDNDYSSKLNHNNDVKFSSDDLDLHGAIINVHLKALDLYAAIMGKTANFSKAEKGAERMISMAPSEPIGHIRLGDLYMMRSNQLRAIQVYKNGYQYMKNDLDRDLLIQRRDTAIIQSKKKFDIIGHLPFDLIHPTLCDLSSSSSPSSLTASITISSHQYHRPRHKSNNLFILLDVSKTWRNKIIDCASLWRTISLGDIDLENVKRWIPYIKQHIIELSIFNFKPNHVLCEMLFLQLIQGGFYQLKSLLMNVPVLRNENIFFEALSI
ncbi:hypothetical protein BDA99DRAFT_525727 [Phascolomyces articulosus]|uniref:Uncharacterized protein n=1 Tax=Phascolomyces articulosus TaxID=60185 RepID=A0AAD5JNZ1_9FUNG|nr:hypothetical protein BDA99DRAFT_525727 [Phascolomyces articulosus]